MFRLEDIDEKENRNSQFFCSYLATYELFCKFFITVTTLHLSFPCGFLDTNAGHYKSHYPEYTW